MHSEYPKAKLLDGQFYSLKFEYTKTNKQKCGFKLKNTEETHSSYM